MNSPGLINPHALPHLPLVNRNHIPEISAIYFVIDQQGTIQYIGRSELPTLYRQVSVGFLCSKKRSSEFLASSLTPTYIWATGFIPRSRGQNLY
jgi:hypothetical protein